MGRPKKLKPAKKPKANPFAVAKRKAKTARRRGKKLRVVAGTDAARALGIK